MTRKLTHQAGVAMIEFALTLGILMMTAAIAADLYGINRLRGNYDRISHNLASVLSVQRYLSAADLDRLLEASVPVAEIGQYELHIYKVNLDRSMDWQPLTRGALSGLCPTLSDGNTFSGDLPEEDQDDSETSIIVVQLCRESGSLTPFTALISNKTIAVTAYNRMEYSNISVDDTLAKELGIDDDDDDEED